MHAQILAAALGCATLIPAAAFASGIAFVTDSGDTMTPGTLRYAIQVEQASKIYIAKNIAEINISNLDTLIYSKQEPLFVHGLGQTIKMDNNITLLELSEGASLTASNLSFVGPAGFNVNNRADLDGDSGKGIFKDV